MTKRSIAPSDFFVLGSHEGDAALLSTLHHTSSHTQRVRRSKYAHTFESSTEPMEMACTLRNWEGQSYYKSRRKSLLSLTAKAAGNCPEILLTPIEYHGGDVGGNDMMDDNDDDDNQLRWPCSISMDDILVVQRHYPASSSANDAKLSITTMQAGSYELGGLTANGHDILLAFLQASLEPERICFADHDTAVMADGYGGGNNNNKNHSSINTFCQENNQNMFSSGSSVSSCLDFDTLQDMHVQNCANAETWPEKMSRRFGRVVHNLTETFADNCCAAVVVPAADSMDHHGEHQDQRSHRHYPQHHQQRDDVPSLACAPRSTDALYLSSPPPRSPAAAHSTTTTTTPTLFVSQRPGNNILYELERANSGSTSMTGGGNNNMNNNNNVNLLASPSKIWKMPSGLSVESEADQSSVLPPTNHHQQQHHHHYQQQFHNKKKSRSFI
jgi:hypothetical protein